MTVDLEEREILMLIDCLSAAKESFRVFAGDKTSWYQIGPRAATRDADCLIAKLKLTGASDSLPPLIAEKP